MIPFIASALLGPWTYAGFLDEPTAPAPAPRVIVVPDNPGAEPAPSGPPEDEPANPTGPPDVPSPEVGPSPPPANPAPAPAHRLVDAWGQTWEHPDPAFLRNWIEARHRAAGLDVAPRTP